MVWDSRNAENPRHVVIPLAGDAVNRPGESNGVDAGPTTAAIAARERGSRRDELPPMNGTGIDEP